MLTFEEFRKLPRSEQNVRYRELSDHDKFLARMNDYSPGAVVVLPNNMTEEEKRKSAEHTKAILKQYFTEHEELDKNK